MIVREKIFLISGDNFLQRRQAAAGIKKRIAKDENISLDTLTFYGGEVSVQTLKESVLNSSFGKTRIIIFKNFQDLAPDCRCFLFDNLRKILIRSSLIFETDRDLYHLQREKRFATDKLFSLILKGAARFRTAPLKKKVSLEDFLSSLNKNDLAASLYVLESLLEGSQRNKLGPQILGILVKKFSLLSSGGGDILYKDRCFQYLWEADRAMKEKGLDARLVIGTLLVKLLGK